MKVVSCEFTEHFLSKPTTNNLGTNIIIVMEQIRKTTVAVEYKKELLRIQETFGKEN